MLPVKVKAERWESLSGFASRVAAANGFSSLRVLADVMGVPLASLSAGTPRVLARLSKRVGQEIETVRDNVPVMVDRRRSWRLGQAMFSKEMRPGRTLRFCPACVRSDMEAGTGWAISRPWRRLAWCTKAVENCATHAVPIVSLPADTPYPDFSRLIEANRDSWTAATPEPTIACELDRYVEARIAGVLGDTFLDGLEVFVAVELCRRLGMFLERHRWVAFTCNEGGDPVSAREAGFEVARQGPEHIKDVVIAILDSVGPVPAAVPSFFDPLRRWLKRNRARPEFSTLATLFQDIAETHCPLGPGDCFIFEVERRRVHTAASAAMDYGIAEDRVMFLAQSAGLVRGPGTTPSKTYLDAGTAHRLLTEASESLTTGRAAADLGTSEEQVRRLMDEGLLPRVEVKQGTRVFSRIRPQDLEEFKVRLFGAPVPASADDPDWRTVTESALTRIYRITETVRMLLLDPGIERRLLPGRPSLKTLLISRSALAARLLRIREAAVATTFPTEYLSLEAVRRRLATTDATVADLIRRGLLQVRVRPHRMPGRTFRTVDLAQMIRFESRYISLHKMARGSGIQIAELKSQLDRAGIRPLYTPHGKIARYYRRRDLAKDRVYTHLL